MTNRVSSIYSSSDKINCLEKLKEVVCEFVSIFSLEKQCNLNEIQRAHKAQHVQGLHVHVVDCTAQVTHDDKNLNVSEQHTDSASLENDLFIQCNNIKTHTVFRVFIM